jgi:hypothetical protein
MFVLPVAAHPGDTPHDALPAPAIRHHVAEHQDLLTAVLNHAGYVLTSLREGEKGVATRKHVGPGKSAQRRAGRVTHVASRHGRRGTLARARFDAKTASVAQAPIKVVRSASRAERLRALSAVAPKNPAAGLLQMVSYDPNPKTATAFITPVDFESASRSETIARAARDLGVPAVDLATVISYETGGKFSPSLRGGSGRKHLGLIQFGPRECARYGVHAGQTFDQQMVAVVRYLKDRGLKPGMGITDLYSTINAGSPGHFRASDGGGRTVKTHVRRMLAGHHRQLAMAMVSERLPNTDMRIGDMTRR